MVIEYAGEMVRPTVADQREAGSYNQLVGAGTYVFSLDDHFMVDATKAGNMAHLLNHSCQPNCYSKHVHVWDETLGVKVPHVVICAKQAIPVSEELTYDYRSAYACLVYCIARLHSCTFVEPSKGVHSVERGCVCCGALKWRQVGQAQAHTTSSIAANGCMLAWACHSKTTYSMASWLLTASFGMITISNIFMHVLLAINNRVALLSERAKQ
jgi:hypothetical protein